jgi:ABC-type phosphate transport system substrate-binding protein
MKSIAFFSAFFLAGALHAGSLAGVVVIANEGVGVDHISAAALKNVYTGRTTYWGGGDHIVIAVLADLTDEALNQVSGMDPSEFRTFWQRLVFSGRGEEPRKATDANALVKFVASTKGAIALAPAGVQLKGVKTLVID